jgi:hypothetical protein
MTRAKYFIGGAYVSGALHFFAQLSPSPIREARGGAAFGVLVQASSQASGHCWPHESVLCSEKWQNEVTATRNMRYHLSRRRGVSVTPKEKNEAFLNHSDEDSVKRLWTK